MKEIKGFPGYFVTKDGRVISNKSGELKELKQRSTEYKDVYLYNNGRKFKRVHRLVAEAYIPNPNNLPQVNHIDENKYNNHVNNLEWVTAQQNQEHSTAKFYILENKNGERFEVFNLRKWCRENNMNQANLNGTYTRKHERKWHKGYRIILGSQQ